MAGSGDTVRVTYYDHPILGCSKPMMSCSRRFALFPHGRTGNVISAAKDWRVIYYNPNKDTGQAEILTEEVL